jgi:hypothetical protein
MGRTKAGVASRSSKQIAALLATVCRKCGKTRLEHYNKRGCEKFDARLGRPKEHGSRPKRK